MLNTPQWLAARRVVLRRELRFLNANKTLLATSETSLLHLLELEGRYVRPSALESAAVDVMHKIPINHPISEEFKS